MLKMLDLLFLDHNNNIQNWAVALSQLQNIENDTFSRSIFTHVPTGLQ